jgi:hypothetical protein
VRVSAGIDALAVLVGHDVEDGHEDVEEHQPHEEHHRLEVATEMTEYHAAQSQETEDNTERGYEILHLYLYVGSAVPAVGVENDMQTYYRIGLLSMASCRFS